MSARLHAMKSRGLAKWLGVGVAALGFVSGRADYAISLTSGRLSQRTVVPGQDLTLDAILTRTGTDTINSAIFRIEVSQPGLIYYSYNWAAPFANGTSDDDSKPLMAQLPMSLQATNLQGSSYPVDVVDLELSNVAGTNRFQEGRLVTMTFKIPANFSGGQINFTPVVDTFANGFSSIMTTAGPSFQLTVGSETRFTASVNPTNKAISLVLVGIPGKTFELQGSTNFINWFQVATLVLTNGTGTFVQTNTGLAQVVYRAVEPKPLKQESSTVGLAAGKFGFKITGTPGRTVFVDASTNLKTWTEIASGIMTSAGIDFADSQPATQPGRFYRLRFGP